MLELSAIAISIRDTHTVYYFNKSCRFRYYNTVFCKKARKRVLNFGVLGLVTFAMLSVRYCLLCEANDKNTLPLSKEGGVDASMLFYRLPSIACSGSTMTQH